MRSVEDFIRISKSVENAICIDRNGETLRRYYRFRPSKNYGGSAVGDVIGCNLGCMYCWCWSINAKLSQGLYEEPRSVVKKLLSIAKGNNFRIVRLSGGEPTLCFKHLVDVLKVFSLERSSELFVLETNGIILGIDDTYVDTLKMFSSFITVRISVKGCTEGDFEKITGFDRSLFYYQVEAVKKLGNRGVPYLVAVPISFCTRKGFANILELLSKHVGDITLNFVEPEVVVLYPSIVDRLCRKGLKPWIAYEPRMRKKVSGDEVDELFKRLCREQS